jgi:hypothetical protein
LASSASRLDSSVRGCHAVHAYCNGIAGGDRSHRLSGGQVQVATSRITGKPGARLIAQQRNSSLMFNDVQEAKEAVDLVLDRLCAEARALDDLLPALTRRTAATAWAKIRRALLSSSRLGSSRVSAC